MSLEPKVPSEATDQELLQQAKKLKSSKLTNAVFIGLLVGVGVYSIANKGLNFLPLILLVFILQAVKRGAKFASEEKVLQQELRARGLV